jgi:hypothetical protein
VIFFIDFIKEGNELFLGFVIVFSLSILWTKTGKREETSKKIIVSFVACSLRMKSRLGHLCLKYIIKKEDRERTKNK